MSITTHKPTALVERFTQTRLFRKRPPQVPRSSPNARSAGRHRCVDP
jgi:hypothetical protein